MERSKKLTHHNSICSNLSSFLITLIITKPYKEKKTKKMEEKQIGGSHENEGEKDKKKKRKGKLMTNKKIGRLIITKPRTKRETSKHQTSFQQTYTVEHSNHPRQQQNRGTGSKHRWFVLHNKQASNQPSLERSLTSIYYIYLHFL